MLEFSHKPVMLEECMDGLSLKDGGVWFDGTVGGGGHSFEILRRTSPSGRLIATDLDDEAIAAATQRLQPFAGRFTIYKSNYKDFERVFEQAGVDKIDGAILDFGISSHQIDDEERGFSYRMANSPLDMRMDQTSGELSQIIQNSIPAKFRFGAPCERKTFQALRIEVNGELDGLYELTLALTRRLKKGGRIVILTFQSLEDRIVKEAFREMQSPCTCPSNFPVCVCGKKAEIKIINKKPITASEEELKENTRSKCAKLRIAEKI